MKRLLAWLPFAFVVLTILTLCAAWVVANAGGPHA